MKFIKNLFLYFSAFVPLFLLLLVKLVVDIINNNLTLNTLNTINLCLLCSLIVFGVCGLLWNTKFADEKSHVVQIKSVKDITDQYFLQYFSLFVLFAVPLDISYINEFCIYILVLIFIGIVYIKCKTFYINPLLNILGYRFYSVTFKSIETGKLRDVKIFCKQKLEKSYYQIKILNDNFAFVVDNANNVKPKTKKDIANQKTEKENNTENKIENIEITKKDENNHFQTFDEKNNQ